MFKNTFIRDIDDKKTRLSCSALYCYNQAHKEVSISRLTFRLCYSCLKQLRKEITEIFIDNDEEDDTIGFSNGARYIPGEVTLARRRGEKVVFDPANHEWKMPDGSIIK